MARKACAQVEDAVVVEIEAEVPATDANGKTFEEQLEAAVKGLVGRLQRTADTRVTQRYDVEQRWIEDLRQFHGKYDTITQAQLTGDKTRSKLFINKTRQKTVAMAAKLYDMLFPTDDRNWGIEPSPVPELVIENERRQTAASDAQEAVRTADAQAGTGTPQQDLGMSPRMVELRMEAERLQALADEMQALMAAARLKSDMMQAEIEDKLKACGYAAKARDAIDWACKIGSGIVEGPITGDKIHPKWRQRAAGGWGLEHVSDKEPSFRLVDPWSYFPDLGAGNSVSDGEGDFVRLLHNRKQLRALSRLPGFNPDAIRRLLKDSPRGSMPSYINELRDITGEASTITTDAYQVWRYIGPIEPEEMRDLSMHLGDVEMMDAVDEIDPLDEANVVIWFCQGEVLYFGPHPMDSGETLFSVFCIEKDETSPFGYGIPYMIRDQQKAMNAAWRLMMDNAPLAARPMVAVNTEILEPFTVSEGWDFVAGKVWRLKKTLLPTERAFDIFDVPSRQDHLQAIIELANRFIDDESGISQVAQGEQGANITKTSSGMAMLMNSTNVILRRVARNFDDDFTVPNIRRMYHFLMQHSEKEQIKGDYEVDARGSSVLLVRELQQQNLMILAAQFGAHPVYGPMLKNPNVLRAIVASMMIPADEMVFSDTEIKAEMARLAEEAEAQAAAGGAPAADPELEAEKIALEREKLDSAEAIASQKVDAERYIAKLRYDATMEQVASKLNMSVEDLEAKMQDKREDRASKERTFAAEAAMTMRRDQQADQRADKDRNVKAAGDAAKAGAKNGGLPSTGGGYV